MKSISDTMLLANMVILLIDLIIILSLSVFLILNPILSSKRGVLATSLLCLSMMLTSITFANIMSTKQIIPLMQTHPFASCQQNPLLAQNTSKFQRTTTKAYLTMPTTFWMEKKCLYRDTIETSYIAKRKKLSLGKTLTKISTSSKRLKSTTLNIKIQIILNTKKTKSKTRIFNSNKNQKNQNYEAIRVY